MTLPLGEVHPGIHDVDATFHIDVCALHCHELSVESYRGAQAWGCEQDWLDMRFSNFEELRRVIDELGRTDRLGYGFGQRAELEKTVTYFRRLSDGPALKETPRLRPLFTEYAGLVQRGIDAAKPATPDWQGRAFMRYLATTSAPKNVRKDSDPLSKVDAGLLAAADQRAREQPGRGSVLVTRDHGIHRRAHYEVERGRYKEPPNLVRVCGLHKDVAGQLPASLRDAA